MRIFILIPITCAKRSDGQLILNYVLKNILHLFLKLKLNKNEAKVLGRVSHPFNDSHIFTSRKNSVSKTFRE